MSKTLLSILLEQGRLDPTRHQQFLEQSRQFGWHPVLLAFRGLFWDWSEVARWVGPLHQTSRVEFRPRLASADSGVSMETQRRLLAVPIERRSNGTWVFAVGDPVDPEIARELQQAVGGSVVLHWADPIRLGEFLAESAGPTPPPPPQAEPVGGAESPRSRSAAPSGPPPAPSKPMKEEAFDEVLADDIAEEGAASEDVAEKGAASEDLDLEDSAFGGAAQYDDLATESPAAAPAPEPAAHPAPIPDRVPAQAPGGGGGSPAKAKRAMAAPVSRKKVADGASEDAPTAVRRRTTVNYFKKMYQSSNYPLTVVISKGQVRIKGAQGSTTTSGKTFSVDRKDSTVTLIPCFPGCLSVPARHEVDAAAEKVEATFFVTPLALGRLPDASVQVWQRGRCLDTIQTPSRVTRQTVTRFAAFLSVLVGISMALARFRTSSIAEPFFDNLPALDDFSDQMEVWGDAVGGVANLGLIATGALSLVTGLFYFDRRPALAEPIEADLPDAP